MCWYIACGFWLPPAKGGAGLRPALFAPLATDGPPSSLMIEPPLALMSTDVWVFLGPLPKGVLIVVSMAGSGSWFAWRACVVGGCTSRGAGGALLNCGLNGVTPGRLGAELDFARAFSSSMPSSAGIGCVED